MEKGEQARLVTLTVRQDQGRLYHLAGDDASREPWGKVGICAMSDILILKNAVRAFLDSCGRNYEFPAGGTNAILTPFEHALRSALSSSAISDSEKVRAISEGLDWDACYCIVIFGIRLAILAVRDTQRELYRLAVVVLVAGSPNVDWRDVLGAFAIFEYCGARLGVGFQAELESLMRIADENKLRPTVDAYFSRSSEMRTLEVMGYRQTGSGNELSFAREGF